MWRSLVAGVLSKEPVAGSRRTQHDYDFVGAASREHEQVATRLGKTKDAVAQAVVRLRVQWWRILDKQVARTVTDPAQIEDEVQFIKNVFWRTAGGNSPRSDSNQQGAN